MFMYVTCLCNIQQCIYITACPQFLEKMTVNSNLTILLLGSMQVTAKIRTQFKFCNLYNHNWRLFWLCTLQNLNLTNNHNTNVLITNFLFLYSFSSSSGMVVLPLATFWSFSCTTSVILSTCRGHDIVSYCMEPATHRFSNNLIMGSWYGCIVYVCLI